MKDVEKTVGRIVDNQKVAFISSVDADGFPNMKAMLAPRKREGIRIFYFTTNTSSMRVQQYLKNNRSCLYFCDRRFFKGVMLKGTMDVLTDCEHKELIWEAARNTGKKVIRCIIRRELPIRIIVF